MTDLAKEYEDKNKVIISWYQGETQKIIQAEKNPEIQKRKLEDLGVEMRRRIQDVSQIMEQKIARESLSQAPENLKPSNYGVSSSPSATSRASSKVENLPTGPWQHRGDIDGDIVSWRSQSTLLFLREKNLFQYDLKNKSETLLGTLDFSIGRYPRSSNEFGYFRFSKNEMMYDGKVDWRDPFKEPERVKDIFSGSLFEATGSFESVLLPVEKLGDTRNSSPFIQRIWGTDLLFDYLPLKPTHNKSVKTFPLRARIFDKAGTILKRLEIPEGPWVWRYTIFDTFKNFSCGTDCYVNFKAFMIHDTIFASAFGKAIPKEGVGLFVREGDKWRRLSENTGLYPLVDDSGTRLAISSGDITSIFFQ